MGAGTIIRLTKNTGLRVRRRKMAGLSLTETAVVLGIIGLIIGALWIAAAQIYVSYRVHNAAQQLTSISQNVRAIYAEQGGVTGGTNSNINLALDQMKAFPLEMRNGTTATGAVSHSWNTATSVNGGGFTVGSVQVYGDDCTGVENAAAAQPCYGVKFLTIPQNACIRLLAQTAQAGMGIQQIIVNAATVVAIPAVPSAIAAACANANNDILWIYLLKDNK